ncbi:MAG: hypothetical protein DRI57_02160 [Deltaproteobacteria bacterium]|nr:MAG: hypothetical protein DRI57_02160 [Deltaproteobacteria bacterium]
MSDNQVHKALEQRIMELEQALEKHKDAACWQTSLLDHQPANIVIQNRSHRIIWANQTACQSAGLSREKLIGSFCYEIWAQRSYECSDCPVTKAFETGKPQDLLRSTPDGRYWQIQGIPLPNGDGKITRALEVRKDVSERLKSEDMLRESEAKFRKMYESSQIGIAMVSLNFRILQANRAYCEMLGYSEHGLVGKTLKDITYPDDVPGNMEKQAKLGRGEIDSFQMEKRFIHKNGETVHGLLNANLIRDKDDKPWYFLGTVLDITERELMAAKLRQAHKMEAVGTLAGGIAHEFNNILGIILGNAELAAEDTARSNPAYGFLEEIIKASLRGKKVVTQILSFSRNSSKECNIVDIAKVVTETLGLLRASISADVEFRTDISDPDCFISGDATQIHQVLINLCTNAAHAMEDHGGILHIILENIVLYEKTSVLNHELLPGTYIRLTVSDTGHGILPEHSDRLFDPFFTTKGVGKGSGLGLSVVHGIITEHKGGIRIQSKPGQGTRAECFFPSAEDRLAIAYKYGC